MTVQIKRTYMVVNGCLIYYALAQVGDVFQQPDFRFLTLGCKVKVE